MKYFVQPWKHQLELEEIMAPEEVSSYFIFGEVGVGKTLMAINAARRKCYNKGRMLRILVVGPCAVRENWKREITTHSKLGPIVVMDGSGKKRQKKLDILLESSDCVGIINYEAVLSDNVYSAIWNFAPDIIIYDEIHKLQSHNSKSTKAWAKISRLASFRVGMTGTHIGNTTMDVFSQYLVVDLGKRFGDNFYSFRAKYFVDKNAGMPSHKHFPKWEARKEMEQELHDTMMQIGKVLLKRDHMDLPPLLKVQKSVEMSPQQAKAYESMRKDFVAMVEGKECTAQMALVKSLRLMQIATGFFKTDEDEIIYFKKNPRLDYLKELVMEIINQGDKLIVWAAFRPNHDMIAKALDELGISWVKYVGGVSDKDKQDAIDRFQTDKSVKVFLGSQGAAGTGITLTQASYAIYYSKGYKSRENTQSEGRFERGGSEIHEKLTRIDLTAPGTIEVTITNALIENKNVADAIMSGKGLS